MSYKQVKYYQDMEDYQAAYMVAREDWAADPSLKWPRSTIAWLLIRMMKNNARAYARRKFVMQLEEFRGLGIPEEDKKLWGALAWPIRDIVNDSLAMQWFTPEFGDSLFDALRGCPFDRPSESYSAMLKAFVSLGSHWHRLPEFIEWWGLDNFTDFDYRRYPENGELVSLVEKVLLTYLYHLYREGEGRRPSEAFHKAMETLAVRSPEQAEKIRGWNIYS